MMFRTLQINSGGSIYPWCRMTTLALLAFVAAGCSGYRTFYIPGSASSVPERQLAIVYTDRDSGFDSPNKPRWDGRIRRIDGKYVLMDMFSYHRQGTRVFLTPGKHEIEFVCRPKWEKIFVPVERKETMWWITYRGYEGYIIASLRSDPSHADCKLQIEFEAGKEYYSQQMFTEHAEKWHAAHPIPQAE